MFMGTYSEYQSMHGNKDVSLRDFFILCKIAQLLNSFDLHVKSRAIMNGLCCLASGS